MDTITLILEREDGLGLPRGERLVVSRRFTRLELIKGRPGPGWRLITAIEEMLKILDEYDRRERKKKPKVPG